MSLFGDGKSGFAEQRPKMRTLSSELIPSYRWMVCLPSHAIGGLVASFTFYMIIVCIIFD